MASPQRRKLDLIAANLDNPYMDPLSDVLSLLNAHGTLSVRLAAGGNWCIQFPAYDSIRFGTLAEGACWLQVEGMPQAVRLQAGDCYLLASGRPYKLGSDLALQDVDMHEVYARVKDRVVYHGDRPTCRWSAGASASTRPMPPSCSIACRR